METFDELEPTGLWDLDEDERGLQDTSDFTCQQIDQAVSWD